MTCADKWRDCPTLNGCTMNDPFLCENNACKPVPSSNFGKDDGCVAAVVCPLYKPHLCADGTCVGDRNFCNVFTPCPKD